MSNFTTKQLLASSAQAIDSVGNQVIIHLADTRYFYSYGSLIAYTNSNGTFITKSHNYSLTTSKYLTNFLNEVSSVIEAKLRDSVYTYISGGPDYAN